MFGNRTKDGYTEQEEWKKVSNKYKTGYSITVYNYSYFDMVRLNKGTGTIRIRSIRFIFNHIQWYVGSKII